LLSVGACCFVFAAVGNAGSDCLDFSSVKYPSDSKEFKDMLAAMISKEMKEGKDLG